MILPDPAPQRSRAPYCQAPLSLRAPRHTALSVSAPAPCSAVFGTTVLPNPAIPALRVTLYPASRPRSAGLAGFLDLYFSGACVVHRSSPCRARGQSDEIVGRCPCQRSVRRAGPGKPFLVGALVIQGCGVLPEGFVVMPHFIMESSAIFSYLSPVTLTTGGHDLAPTETKDDAGPLWESKGRGPE